MKRVAFDEQAVPGQSDPRIAVAVAGGLALQAANFYNVLKPLNWSPIPPAPAPMSASGRCQNRASCKQAIDAARGLGALA